jgi:hypothetical protein
MCGFKEYVQEMTKEIIKDIQFFPEKATSQIVFIEPDGNKDCKGNEIKDSNKLLTLQFFFSGEVTSGEAQIIRDQICSSKNFKELFDEFGNFVSSLTRPLNEVQFKGENFQKLFPSESTFPDPTTLPKYYLEEILKQREDPKVWKDIK